MEDLHQGTLDKKQYLENLGYRYVSMWECDYEREIQSNGSMRSFVDSLCIIDTLEPRNAFYGGEQKHVLPSKKPTEIRLIIMMLPLSIHSLTKLEKSH